MRQRGDFPVGADKRNSQETGALGLSPDLLAKYGIKLDAEPSEGQAADGGEPQQEEPLKDILDFGEAVSTVKETISALSKWSARSEQDRQLFQKSQQWCSLDNVTRNSGGSRRDEVLRTLQNQQEDAARKNDAELTESLMSPKQAERLRQTLESRHGGLLDAQRDDLACGVSLAIPLGGLSDGERQKIVSFWPGLCRKQSDEIVLPAGLCYGGTAVLVRAMEKTDADADFICRAIVSAQARAKDDPFKVCVIQPEAPSHTEAEDGALDSLHKLSELCPSIFLWAEPGARGATRALSRMNSFLDKSQGRLLIVAMGIGEDFDSYVAGQIRGLVKHGADAGALLLASCSADGKLKMSRLCPSWVELEQHRKGILLPFALKDTTWEGRVAWEGSSDGEGSLAGVYVRNALLYGNKVPPAALPRMAGEYVNDIEPFERRNVIEAARRRALACNGGSSVLVKDFDGVVCLGSLLVSEGADASQGSEAMSSTVPLSADLSRQANIKISYGEEDGPAAQRLVQELTWEFLRQIPPSLLNVKIVDTSQGGAAAGYLLSSHVPESLFDAKSDLVRNQTGIEETFKALVDKVDATLRTRTGARGNLVAYNKAHPENAASLTLLVINSLESLPFGRGSWERDLHTLMERGYQGGVYILVSCRAGFSKPAEGSPRFLAGDEEEGLAWIDELTDVKIDIEDQPRLVPSQLPIAPLDPLATPEDSAAANTFFDALRREMKEQELKGLAFSEIAGETLFDKCSADGLQIPIGKGTDGATVSLELGDSAAHALICGSTGSGKSTLLHTLILSAISHYAPEELELYLLDFKQGSEFGPVYGNPQQRIPHMSVVATSALPEFGEGVLGRLCEEIERRSELFKSVGVNSIKEYREAGNALPRILVVIDEAAVLFPLRNSSLQVFKRSAEHLTMLVQQGRSYGIHLVLSSQNYMSSMAIESALHNVNVRIGLKNSVDNTRKLFETKYQDALEAFGTESGKGIAVMCRDVVSAGERPFQFRVSYCNPDNGDRSALLERVSRTCRERGFVWDPTKNKVLDVATPERLSEEIADRSHDAALKSGSMSGGQTIIPFGESIKEMGEVTLKLDPNVDSNILSLIADSKMELNVTQLLADAVLLNPCANMLLIDFPAFSGAENARSRSALKELERSGCGRIRIARNEVEALSGLHCVYDEWTRRSQNREGIAWGDVVIFMRGARKTGLFEGLVAGEVKDQGHQLASYEAVQTAFVLPADHKQKKARHSFDFFGDAALKLGPLLDGTAGQAEAAPEGHMAGELREDPYGLEWGGELTGGAPGASVQLKRLMHEGPQYGVYVIISSQDDLGAFMDMLRDHDVERDFSQRIFKGAASELEMSQFIGESASVENMNPNIVYLRARTAGGEQISCQVKPYLAFDSKSLDAWRKSHQVPSDEEAADAPRFHKAPDAPRESSASGEKEEDEADLSLIGSDMLDSENGLFGGSVAEEDLAAYRQLVGQDDAETFAGEPQSGQSQTQTDQAQIPSQPAGPSVSLGSFVQGEGELRLPLGPDAGGSVAVYGALPAGTAAFSDELPDLLKKSLPLADIEVRKCAVVGEGALDALGREAGLLRSRLDAFAEQQSYGYWDLKERNPGAEGSFLLLVLEGMLDAVAGDDDCLEAAMQIARLAGSAGCLAVMTGASALVQSPRTARLLGLVRRAVSTDLLQINGIGVYFGEMSLNPADAQMFELGKNG